MPAFPGKGSAARWSSISASNVGSQDPSEIVLGNKDAGSEGNDRISADSGKESLERHEKLQATPDCPDCGTDAPQPEQQQTLFTRVLRFLLGVYAVIAIGAAMLWMNNVYPFGSGAGSHSSLIGPKNDTCAPALPHVVCDTYQAGEISHAGTIFLIRTLS